MRTVHGQGKRRLLQMEWIGRDFKSTGLLFKPLNLVMPRCKRNEPLPGSTYANRFKRQKKRLQKVSLLQTITPAPIAGFQMK